MHTHVYSRPNTHSHTYTHTCTNTQVEFPGLGCMLTNKTGRFDFVFAPLFMEYFEREAYANVKEVRSQLLPWCMPADRGGSSAPGAHC